MTGTRQPSSSGPVIGSVCTGYGGLDLGVLAALGGGRLAWCADPDPHVTQILAARLPGVPNLGDIRAVDWTAVEPVEVLTAGFPCQDISGAGKRLGIENGARSGLWTDIVAAVRVLRPALLVVENVAALRWKGGGLHRVLGDLATTGYDALWRSVRAADIGAAHRRERVFLLAWRRNLLDGPAPADADRARRNLQRIRRATPPGQPVPSGPPSTAPDTDRGLPERPGEHRRLAGPSEPSTCSGGNGNGMGMPLSIAVRLLPTPTASDAKNCTHAGQDGGPSLPHEVLLLPTPRASDTGTSGRKAGAGFRPPLSQQVIPLVAPEILLPTPRATDGTKGSPAQHGSTGDLMLPPRS